MHERSDIKIPLIFTSNFVHSLLLKLTKTSGRLNISRRRPRTWPFIADLALVLVLTVVFSKKFASPWPLQAPPTLLQIKILLKKWSLAFLWFRLINRTSKPTRKPITMMRCWTITARSIQIICQSSQRGLLKTFRTRLWTKWPRFALQPAELN